MGNSYVAAGGDDEGICVNCGTTALRTEKHQFFCMDTMGGTDY